MTPDTRNETPAPVESGSQKWIDRAEAKLAAMDAPPAGAVEDAALALILAARPGMTATSIVPNPKIKALADALAENRLATPAARQGGEAQNPPGFGIACTVAWTELVQAMRADGHDVKDKSGPNTRKWMEGIVRDTFAALSARPAAGDGILGYVDPEFPVFPIPGGCVLSAHVLMVREPHGKHTMPVYRTPPAREGVPEGFVMVPRTMTCDMYAAGIRTRNLGGNVSDIYNAIVAAAPTAGEGSKDA